MADITQFKDSSGTVHNIRDGVSQTQINYNTNKGVKNLLNLSHSYTYSTNGLDFTVDSDEGSVTVNGKATANTFFNVQLKKDEVSFLYNDYVGMIFNGAPAGASASTYRLSVPIYNSSGTWLTEKHDYGSGVTLSSVANALTGRVTITIFKNVTVSNLKFRPMIRESFIEDSTFKPYALSNAELTKMVPVRLFSTSANDSDLASLDESIMITYAAGIAGKSDAGLTIVRTYKDSFNGKKIQIAESQDGTRKTRYYNGSSWGSWV